MFENFSYKQKLIGLGAILVLLFLTANKRSFKTTLNAYGQMQEVASRLRYMQVASYDSKQLQNQISFYDNLIGKQNIEADIVQQSILDFATNFEKARIDNLSETHISSAEGFEVITNQLILEGDFATLTEVVYEFEKKFEMASLVSVNYIKEKNYNKRKNKLKVQLIFQNYEKSI